VKFDSYRLILSYLRYIVVGNTGTGKTIAVQQIVTELDENVWTSLALNMSAQTSSNAVQEIIEGRVEKRIKNKYSKTPNSKRFHSLQLTSYRMPKTCE
jgi:dynein heavy chain, axonemal